MHLSLTAEPVSLSAALPVRVERVKRDARSPIPTRFAHFHKVAEIVLFESVKGVIYAEAECLDLTAGCATWVPSMSAHDFDLARGATRWTLIQFHPHFAQVRPPSTARCVTFSSPDRRRLATLAEFLSGAVDAGETQEARRYLELILLMFDRGQHHHGESITITPTHALARFRPLLERLRAAPSSGLSTDEAASLCNLSPAYFSRLFRQVFGFGFAEYMTQMRLDDAAVALAASQEPVSSIGFRAGFSSHAYFTAQFRQRFGRTPSEFRRQSQNRASKGSPDTAG